jgi:hypothetical protein
LVELTLTVSANYTHPQAADTVAPISKLPDVATPEPPVTPKTP